MSLRTTAYLIRHGSTQWNEEGRWQCMDDKALSETGQRQADAAAEALFELAKSKPIAKVYSSPLTRAKQTADRIAAKLGIEAEEEPLIREFNCGDISGLDFKEARRQFAEFYSRLESNWLDERYPGGETHREYAELCVLPALQKMAALHRGRAVVAVTHGGFINAAVAHIMGFPEGRPLRRLTIDNCSYSELEIETNEETGHQAGRVISINITAHLRVAGLLAARRL
ncbi:MAG TPA: histidine phosphatase family protein [Bacillota bacterium]|nr:histidine phosphatase family protein [Bacillota bacterium]